MRNSFFSVFARSPQATVANSPEVAKNSHEIASSVALDDLLAKTKKKGERGFTLIELLIASSAFVILVGSLGGIYLTFVRRHTTEIKKQSLQQDIGVFFETLDREVRTAYGTTFGPLAGGPELFLKNQNLACVRYRLGTGADAGRLVRDIRDFVLGQPPCNPALASTYTGPSTSSAPATSRQTEIRRLHFFGIQNPTPMEVVRGAPGIVSYWTFDELSGPAVADVANNGHTGTHQNSPTISADVAPLTAPNLRSLQFNGTDQYVSVPDSADWAFTGDFTIATWVKFAAEDLSGPGSTFAAQDEGSGVGKKRWSFFRPGSGGTSPVQTQCQNRTAFLVSDGTAPDPGNCVAGNLWTPTVGTWYHLVVTRSGDTYTFYRNGAVDGDGTLTGAMPDVAAELRLGQAADAAYLNGNLDDTRVYKRALSAAEVTTLAAGNELPGSGAFILTGPQGRLSVSLRACPRGRPEPECTDLQTTMTSRQQNAPPTPPP